MQQIFFDTEVWNSRLYKGITKKDWIVITWIAFLASLLSVPFAFGLTIGAAYHPASNGALAAPFNFYASLALVPLSFGLALWHSLRPDYYSSDDKSSRKMAVNLALLLGLVLAVIVSGRLLNPQPDFYLRYVGNTPYAIPRHYGNIGAREPSQDGGIAIQICSATKTAIYAARCPQISGFPRELRPSLSRRAIGRDDFQYLRILDRAGVKQDQGTFQSVPESSEITKIEAGDLRGFRLQIFSGFRIYLLDDGLTIQTYVNCRSEVDGGCKVATNTPYGVLRFPSPGPVETDFARWRKDQVWIQTLFDTWRCKEPSCDGLFGGEKNQEP